MSMPDQVQVGRGNETDMRVSDISVSRLHALIKKSAKGYYYLEDKYSKFGTLAMIKYPIKLDSNGINYIQAGRSMLEISFNE